MVQTIFLCPPNPIYRVGEGRGGGARVRVGGGRGMRPQRLPVATVVPLPPVASRMGRDPRLAPPASMLHVHEHVRDAWTCPLRVCSSSAPSASTHHKAPPRGGLYWVSAFPPPLCSDLGDVLSGGSPPPTAHIWMLVAVKPDLAS